MMPIAVTVTTAAHEHLSVELYADGLLQITISDEVIAETRLDHPTPDTESARKALRRMFRAVADLVPLQVEGRDFDLLDPRPTTS